jgi:predicted Zn-dependent protease with MMP-like domain
MYPLPRLLITMVALVGIAYAVVAVFLLVPQHEAETLWFLGVPVVLIAGVSILARGEPDDLTSVHSPTVPGAKSPRMSDAEFDALEDQVERLGQQAQVADPRRDPTDTSSFDPARDEGDFIDLVRQAIDELPSEFMHALDHVGVAVSDQGAVQRINGRLQPLYGLYVGYGGRGSYLIGAPVVSAQPDHIVIFRDTLVHDYGADPVRLRQEVTRVLRHELAHHLGWDEPGVHALGL